MNNCSPIFHDRAFFPFPQTMEFNFFFHLTQKRRSIFYNCFPLCVGHCIIVIKKQIKTENQSLYHGGEKTPLDSFLINWLQREFFVGSSQKNWGRFGDSWPTFYYAEILVIIFPGIMIIIFEFLAHFSSLV